VNKLYNFAESRYFWLTGVLYLLLMEGIALFYQYGPGMWYPCALCVQVRAWVMGSIIFALLGLVMVKSIWWRWMALNLTIVMLAGALYTSYYAYGVELGTVVSSCTMGAGFPEFMPLDRWIPLLFEAQGICGLSPDMPLGFTMVESLLITLSAPLLVLIAVWIMHVRKMISNEI